MTPIFLIGKVDST